MPFQPRTGDILGIESPESSHVAKTINNNPGGRGRQRYNLTGTGGTTDDFRRTNSLDDEFDKLIDNMKGMGGDWGGGAGAGTNVPTVMTVRLDDPQFKELIDTMTGVGKTNPKPNTGTGGNLGTSVGQNTGAGGDPNIPVARKLYLVEMLDTQFQNLIDAIGGSGGGGGGDTPVEKAASTAQKVADGFAKVIKFVAASINALGDAAVKVARNDGIGLLADGLSMASKAVGKIPVLGGMLASGLEVATAGLNTFSKILSAFAERGRELAKYNAQIASAVAIAQVQKIVSDIREANLGAEKYASLIIKEQQLQSRIQEALLPIKMALMQLAEKVMPYMQAAVEMISENIQTFSLKWDVFVAGLNRDWAAMAVAGEKLNNKLKEIAKNTEKDRSDEINFLNTIIKKAQGGGLNFGDFAFDPVNPGGDNGIRIPLFNPLLP
jgi:hypothetical protein